MRACDTRADDVWLPGVRWQAAGRPPVQEAEGPVVDGEPHDAHVVCVEHAVAEAHTLPLSHQPGRAPGHLQQDGRRCARWPGPSTRLPGPAQRPALTWEERPHTTVSLVRFSRSVTSDCDPMNCSAPGLPVHRLLHTHYCGFYPNQRNQGTLTFSRYRSPRAKTMSKEGSKSPRYQANPPQVQPHPGLQGMRLHQPTWAARAQRRPCRPTPSQGEPCEPQVRPTALWPAEQPTRSAPSEAAGTVCTGWHHTRLH